MGSEGNPHEEGNDVNGGSSGVAGLLAAAASTLATDPPFSFIYDGRPSAELVPKWRRAVEKSEAAEGKVRYVATYTDPATGLEVTCELTLFADYPAADWVLRLQNKGQADTPVIESILPLDLQVTPLTDDVVLHHANGSSCAPEDFQPLATDIRKGRHIALAPVGGRSSNGRLPFFNLQWDDEGLVGAIGWSGQWQLQVDRDVAGPLALQAGQQKTRLKLHPGESIRTPRILLVRWQGDRMDGHNLTRRLIYQFYTPLLAGEKPLPPTQCNTWFPVNTGVNATERNQAELLRAYGPIGIEYLVMDAGWYGTKKGDWYGQVGTWRPRADAFPKGLKPLGDAAREAGIQFGMWFEPERVRAGSDLDREHPEWIIKLGEEPNRLLDLGLPEVQDWFVQFVSRHVDEIPLGYYRQDFNMDPLKYWQQADAPDRVGMTEIRYIEGLYRIWDRLLERYPNMMVEGCSSGGRRMDLESLSRCHTYWRSDLYFNSTANQAHIHGASLYLPGNYFNIPLQADPADTYAFRSILGAALCSAWDPRKSDFDREQAKARVDELKARRHLAVGDFYPLLPHSCNDGHWNAYQFHRADLGEGMVLAFRNAESAYLAAEIRLCGLDPKADYDVTFEDTGKRQRLTGGELAKPMRVEIEDVPGSHLITYRAVQTH